MDVIAILELVSKLVPVAKSIIDMLHGAAEKPGVTNEVLDLVGDLTPKLQNLMVLIDTIKNQTEAQRQAVWDAVRSDYEDASTKLDAAIAAAKANQ